MRDSPQRGPESDRRFTRLRPGAASEAPGYWVVPANGLCLSTFLILRAPSRPTDVLLGRLDPAAPWYHLGGLDPSRVATIGAKWLLPASQWLFFEGPQESAARIAREQLESPLPPVTGPTVVSESTPRPSAESRDPHWDVHFLFEGLWPSATPPKARAWRELRFVDVAHLPRLEIGRGHGDILDLVGLSPQG